MCYSKEYLVRQQLIYAKRYGNTKEEIQYYEDQLKNLELQKALQPKFFATGFSHPLAPVITDDKPTEIQAFSWGLIPPWCKDAATATKMSNTLLNARGETIFEKPSFKKSAIHKRCLVICVDGFFEYYHKGKSTFPHFIKLKNDEPITFAGLWSTWHHPELGVRNTYTIVTTKANQLMSHLHNNPKREDGDSRMPVILPRELERDWLTPIEDGDKPGQEMIQSLIQPYPDDLMEAYPVRQLTGAKGVGNTELANQRFEYEELF